MSHKFTYFLLTVLLFILVFYQRDIGINLAIFTIISIVLSYYGFSDYAKRRDYWMAITGTIISSCTFAYYQDPASFFGIFISMHWLAMIGFDPEQKMLKALVLVPLNYIMMLPNIFGMKLQLSKEQTNVKLQNIIAFGLIPVAITALFIMIYAFASSTLTNFFESLNFSFEFNFFNFFALLIMGSVLMFAFWFFRLPSNWELVSEKLHDNFHSNTFSPNPNIEILRKSGEITFILLNIVIILFIGVYGYENFFVAEDAATVSSNVHERVYAVMGSIVLAIILIMYFFRGYFNFDKFNRNLKNLTFSWILLNGFLVFVALAKNVQYVYLLGLTEKRLGVFAFLILCWIGLFYTFMKVKEQKTNWFLLNRMLKVSYLLLLCVAFFNWSFIITRYNIATHQFKNDIEYHKSLPYNHLLLQKYLNSNTIETTTFSKEPSLDGRLYDVWVAHFSQKNE